MKRLSSSDWATVGQEGLLKGIIHLVATHGPVELIEMACDGDSFRHPNGFYKVPLAAGPRGEKLVCHAWLGEVPAMADDIHSHRWDFASTILCGSLWSSEYDATPPNDGQSVMTAFECSSGSAGLYRTHRVGEVGVRLLRAALMPSGTSYFVSRSILHHIRPTDDRAVVTLFLQGAEPSKTSIVLRDDGSPEEIPLSSGSKVEHRRILERIVAAVSGGER